MPFRKAQSVPSMVECDTLKGCCEMEKSKSPKGKGHRRTSSGSIAKLSFRRKSSNDLKSICKDIDFDSLTPLKPLRSCLSTGNLSSSLKCVDENTIEPPKTHKRSVSFGDLTIREHPRALRGMSSNGPMLGLDWYTESSSSESGDCDSENQIQCKTIEVSIDDYENTREPRRPRPPIISKAKRERLLKKFGVTDEDLLDAEKERNAEREEALKKDDSNILDVMGKVVRKTLKSGPSETQKELDSLMLRAAEAERIRKLRMEKYHAEQRKLLLAACEAQIKAERSLTEANRNESMDSFPSDGTESTKSSSSDYDHMVEHTFDF